MSPKVIGVQIAAHTGILMPPHNPFFGKRSISSPPKWFERGPQPSRMITIQEFRTIERGLKVSEFKYLCKSITFHTFFPSEPETNRSERLLYKISL